MKKQTLKSSSKTIYFFSIFLTIIILTKSNPLSLSDIKILTISPNNFSSYLSLCFKNLSKTTLEKKPFFYSSDFSKKLCLKTAEFLNFKQDIISQQYFHKCFPLCNNCIDYGTKNSMKCISCIKNFTIKNNNCYYDPQISHKRKLVETSGDIYNDYVNTLIERENQAELSSDKSLPEFNFHIDLSPYYLLAIRCKSEGFFFIEKNRCVEKCSQTLEEKLGYPPIKIPIGPNNEITVCDCAFRCCIKIFNNLAKSLDRGFIDGSYQYFRSTDGKCHYFNDKNYLSRYKKNTYLLAQDFVPCFLPIYKSNITNENILEYYITGYGKTTIGNKCNSLCPGENYYYLEEKSACYPCVDSCLKCEGVAEENDGKCTECSEEKPYLYNGFCVDFCPGDYGLRGNVCVECDYDVEIYIDGKCVTKNEDNEYGDENNPSFQDPSNPNIYHYCIEHLSESKYKINKSNSKCANIECDPDKNGFIEKGNNICFKTLRNCLIPTTSEASAECKSCEDGYLLENSKCVKNLCTFSYEVSGTKYCVNSCPSEMPFYYGSTCSTDCDKFDVGMYHTKQNECLTRCDFDQISLDEEKLCLDDCDENYPENDDNLCTNCASNNLYNGNGTCIIPDETFSEKYVILTDENSTKYGKVDNCYVIDECGDYHINETLIQKHPETCKNKCPTGYEKYILSEDDIVCKKCYETCETCNHTGEAGNHKCKTCKEGYSFSERLYGVCEKNCEKGYYYVEKRVKLCEDTCPENIPYGRETETKYLYECVENCTGYGQLYINGSINCTKNCPEDYPYKIGDVCYSSCPDEKGLYNGECIDCKENNLFYYKGYCVKVENELPIETYIKSDSSDPNPGNADNDGKLHSCLDKGDSIEYLYDYPMQNCTSPCPSGYYVYSFGDMNGCSKCNDANCYLCDMHGCLDNDCPSEYFTMMVNGEQKCVSRCPPEKPVIVNGSQCVENCEENLVKFVISGKEEFGNANYKCVEPSSNSSSSSSSSNSSSSPSGNSSSSSDLKKNTCKEQNKILYKKDNNCYLPHEIPENTFYNPDIQSGDENILSECLSKISENEYYTGYYFIISNCPKKCPDNFFYTNNNICKKCHSNCETCFDTGNDSSNNCLTCADTTNKIYNPYLFNCVNKCDKNFHFDENTKQLICDSDTENKKCPEDNYIDADSENCVENCEKIKKLYNGIYCVLKCPDGKIEYNGYCVSNNTPLPDNSNNKNNNNNNNDNGQNTNFTDNGIKVQKEIIEKMETIEKNLINNINNTVETIGGNNISLCSLSLKNNNKNNNFNKCGDSNNTIDFSECLEKIKQKYPNEEIIYFMQFDLDPSNVYREEKRDISLQVKYKTFFESGREINLTSICENTNTTVKKNVQLSGVLENNTNLFEELLEKDIDVYDINDPFFNDPCYPYVDENGNDVPLENRVKDYYQNTSLCVSGCEYIKIDQNTSQVVCNCPTENLAISNDENIMSFIDSNLFPGINDVVKSETIGVIKCYKKAFQSNNVKKNIGFWIYLGLATAILLLLFGLLCYNFTALNEFLFNYSKNVVTSSGNNVNIEEEIVERQEIEYSENSNHIDNISEVNSRVSNPPPKFSKISPKKYMNSNQSMNYNNEEENYSTKKKYTMSLNNNKKDYPSLNVSAFGKGDGVSYKMSNNINYDDINFNTPKKKISSNISMQFNDNSNEKANPYNVSNPNSPSSLTNSENHFSYNINGNSNNKLNIKDSGKILMGSQVDLEPEGALLAANNFFDTCKIVKFPNEYGNQKSNMSSSYKRSSITKELNGNKEAKYNKNHFEGNNNRNASTFYRKNSNVINLPGFPPPEFITEEEVNKKRGKDLDIISEANSNDIEKEINSLFSQNSRRNKRFQNKRYNHKSLNSSDIINEEENYETSKKLQSNNINNATNPITINKYYYNYNSQDQVEKINKESTIEKNKKKEINTCENSGKKASKNKKKGKRKNRKKIITTTTKKKSNRLETNTISFVNWEIDEADFDNIMLNDNRSFCGIYCSFLSNRQMFVSICLGVNVYVPWILRLAICLFTIGLYFTLTALLMKISQFEKRYKHKGNIDIWYLIKNEYENIIYVTLISRIMNFVTSYIFIHYSIKKVIRDHPEGGPEFVEELKNAIYRYKLKLYISLIVFIILTLLEMFFVACFCYVYQGSQREWIMSSCITLVFNIILGFVLLFLATIFRVCAIICECWLLYIISKIFMDLA